jgi:hypothetical protein
MCWTCALRSSRFFRPWNWGLRIGGGKGIDGAETRKCSGLDRELVDRCRGEADNKYGVNVYMLLRLEICIY